MPRLPGPANVPQVSPPRPMQIGAPAAAFGAPENEALANFSNTAARVVDQRLSRIEAMNHARAENTLIERSQQKLLELNSEKDLSLPDTQAEYADWLEQQKQELLGQFGGRSKQQAFLLRNLDNTAARFRGRANALAEEISLDNLDQALSRQLGTYQRTAESDPTRVLDLMNEWQQQVREVYGPAMPPGMESASLVAGQEQIVKSALRPFLVTGDVTAARELLGQYSPLLPEDSVAELNGYIREQAAEQDEIIGWVNTMRSLGYEPTLEQILAKSDALPPTPLVQIGGGASAPIMGDIPKEMVAIPDATEPSGYRLEPMRGGSIEAERQAAEAAGVSKEAGQQQQADIINREVNRVFDVIESDPVFGVGPVGGRLGQFVPGSGTDLINQSLTTLRANIGFSQLQAMRDASPTGGALGQVSEQENRLLQSLLGNIETATTEEAFVENLIGIQRAFNRVAYGSDAEINLAVEQGRVTPAQASALIQTRNQADARVQSRGQALLESDRPQPQQPQATDNQFRSVVQALGRNPEALTAEEIGGMGFSREQLQAILALLPEPGAEAEAAPPEVQSFMETTPDAGQYAAQMADLLESGQANTLDEAYRMAKGM